MFVCGESCEGLPAAWTGQVMQEKRVERRAV
jgi:hypothetical protein